MKKSLLSFLFFLVLIACGDEKKDAAPVAMDLLYFDYQVSAEEGNDNLTIKAEFRLEDREGDAVSIGRMGEARLDGVPLPEDSTRRTGYFYEAYRPIASFSGPHVLSFVTRSNNQVQEKKESFDFTPMVLQTVLGDTVRRAELELELGGVREEDVLRVVLTDTSAGDGINRIDSLTGNRVTLSVADMQALSNGPVMLELIRETERPLENGFEAGGRLLITYGLRRQFILTD